MITRAKLNARIKELEASGYTVEIKKPYDHIYKLTIVKCKRSYSMGLNVSKISDPVKKEEFFIATLNKLVELFEEGLE